MQKRFLILFRTIMLCGNYPNLLNLVGSCTQVTVAPEPIIWIKSVWLEIKLDRVVRIGNELTMMFRDYQQRRLSLLIVYFVQGPNAPQFYEQTC
jgi:hypothetical protein